MRYFSTFTGIGGFEIGIQNAHRATVGRKQADSSGDDETGQGLVASEGQDPSTENGLSGASTPDWTDERPLCVGYSEIDKYAIKVYERNFPNVRNFGDITKINADELPDFDCIVGGFPCQAFSIAGKRRGFEDTRGTLFFDLARILRAKQPRLFVFENVKGLLSHDNGNTFRTIIATIDELGYDCQWQVLNSKNHGVPQNRERVYIVGHLRGTPRPEVFPIGEDDKVSAERQGQISPTITSRYYKQGQSDPYLSKQQINVKEWNQPDSNNTNGRKPYPKIRRLTPVECERLQGFPDNFTAQGTDGAISDTQRYKMCGNAVTTNVVQAVFERIFNESN